MQHIIIILAAVLLLFINKWLFYIGLGIYTAMLFYQDKQAAIHGKRRIPEKQLMFFALIGGVFGALAAIFLFRHKSAKPNFYFPVFLLAGIHILLIIIF